MDGDTAEDHAVSARWRDKMSDSLVDEDDVAAGHGEIVLVACDVRLSFLDVLKFNLLVPVPVYGRGIGRAAVDSGEVYGISAEQEFLCALFIKIGFHKMSSLFCFFLIGQSYLVTLIDSRSLFVPDIVRRFFVRCAQIYEAYVARTLIKFVCI